MATDKFEVTRIKTFNGREGQGLNATITKNGKAICFVMDDASGGEVDYDYSNPLQNAASFKATTREMADAAERDLTAFCKNWYETSPDAQESRDQDAEMKKTYADWEPSYVADWVNTLVDDHANKKRMDRMAKTKTLFRVAGEQYQQGEWRVLKKVYGPDVQKWLDQKYPNKVTEIYGVKAAS
jgi:hypothetical protein